MISNLVMARDWPLRKESAIKRVGFESNSADFSFNWRRLKSSFSLPS